MSMVLVCLSRDLSLHRADIRGKSRFLLFSRKEQISNEIFLSFDEELTSFDLRVSSFGKISVFLRRSGARM